MNLDETKQWLRNIDNVKNLVPEEVKLEEFVAEGGQGIVYRGYMSSEQVAVKIYFPGQLDKRVEREITALKTLRCLSIVSLHWSGTVVIESDELPLIATTFVDGVNLRSRIKTKKLDNDELSRVAFDVAQAISAMWAERIVHRDLKTDNILLKPNGRACVIDLGLARHVDRSSLTVLGGTWGTLGYLSPEQSKAMRQLTCKSDMFALGIILIECALGKHPTSYDQLRLFARKFHENLPPELASWEYADMLKELLHPRPTKRPKPSKVLEILSAYAME